MNDRRPAMKGDAGVVERTLVCLLLWGVALLGVGLALGVALKSVYVIEEWVGRVNP